MQKTQLGKTNIEVSPICFGTLTIGPLQANLPVEEGSAVVEEAIALGINFFDTAELYQTYAYLKPSVKKHSDNMIVATKTYAYTAQMAQAALESARRELDRDYIDIFLLHEQESEHTLRGHAEALDFLQNAKAKGIIKAVGLSTHHVAGVRGAVKHSLDIVHPLINKNGLGIADGSLAEMEAAVESAFNSGLGVYTMKALGGGNLFKNAVECLDYIIGFKHKHSVAIGMQSIEELKANVGYFETGAFSPAALEYLRSKERRIHVDDWCTGCGECVKRCGQKALSVKNSFCRCDYNKCVLCGYCSSVCPMWAIKVV